MRRRGYISNRVWKSIGPLPIILVAPGAEMHRGRPPDNGGKPEINDAVVVLFIRWCRLLQSGVYRCQLSREANTRDRKFVRHAFALRTMLV